MPDLGHGVIYLISIHVPREGHDANVFRNTAAVGKFQSTCPARGTTNSCQWSQTRRCDFNPRAPRGARPPTTESPARENLFQSTCPARGTTVARLKQSLFNMISIHVPREGHDPLCGLLMAYASYFNPRAPRGARHRVWYSLYHFVRYFNPRAPRGARLPEDQQPSHADL